MYFIIKDKSADKKFIYYSFWVLCFLFISRVFAIYFIPLNDTTEARYGEIARIMLETGNWVTPMQQYGVPFWAKPPLSSWLSAISMYFFGVNEFAARFPALILSIAILYLIWDLLRKKNGVDSAITGVLVLASSIFFFLDAGVVMTDPALLFCTTLITVSFWQAVVLKNKTFGFLFFVGIGLGLLAKGPIAIVLTGLPIFIWVLRYRKLVDTWKNLPWISGTVISLAIALPWYILAEKKTPGFLNYFIIGEHINRFLQPNWAGDKYGFAHKAMYGSIWLYAFLGLFPWSILAISWLGRSRKNLVNILQDNDHWLSYLFICMFVPLIFFTFSRNIIYPYVFPILPIFALLFAEIVQRAAIDFRIKKKFLFFSLIPGVFFILVTLVFIFKPMLIEKSQKRIVKLFQENTTNTNGKLIYWSSRPEYSASFYSTGKAYATINANELCHFLSNGKNNIFIIDSIRLNQAPKEIVLQLKALDEISIANKKFTVYQADAVKCK